MSMLLTLNNGKKIQARKFTREYSTNWGKRSYLNITATYNSEKEFNAVQRNVSKSGSFDKFYILDEEGNVHEFEGYTLENVIEIHESNIHDLTIRCYKDISDED